MTNNYPLTQSIEKFISEAPFFNDQVMMDIYKETQLHSRYFDELKKQYKLIISTEQFDIYFSSTYEHILIGKPHPKHHNHFVVFAEIKGYHNFSEKVDPPQLTNQFFIAITEVDHSLRNRGLGKLIYVAISKYFDVISDSQHYYASKQIWFHLAKQSDINVYVYNKKINNYFRDNKGIIIKYNTLNIEEKAIWNDTDNAFNIFLIATTKKLS